MAPGENDAGENTEIPSYRNNRLREGQGRSVHQHFVGFLRREKKHSIAGLKPEKPVKYWYSGF